MVTTTAITLNREDDAPSLIASQQIKRVIDSSATPTNLAIIRPTIINIGSYLNNGDWRFTPFFKSNLLVSIDLANSPNLSTIGDRAFSDCSNLSNILFPPSLSIVGEYAFYKCGFHIPFVARLLDDDRLIL